MSRTPTFFIEKKNRNTGKWENVTLYTKKDDEYEPVYWDTGNADYELFELLFDDLACSTRGVPTDLSREAFMFFDTIEDFGGIQYSARKCNDNAWLDYIELSLLAQKKKYKKILRRFKSNIDFILDMNGIYWIEPGEVRILCSIS